MSHDVVTSNEGGEDVLPGGHELHHFPASGGRSQLPAGGMADSLRHVTVYSVHDVNSTYRVFPLYVELMK